jgi:hypothetical protein
MNDDYCVVVPTRGDATAMNRIVTNILSALPDVPLMVISNTAGASPEAPALLDCHGVRHLRCPGGGVARVRNMAMRVSRSRYLVFLDDDVVPTLAAVRRLVDALQGAGAGVATARVVASEDGSRAAAIYRDFLGLDRGADSAIYSPDRIGELSPFTAWSLGVGAAFALDTHVLDRLESPPAFDEALSNGTRCGGAEDSDFFFQCVRAGATVAYCAESVFEHRYSPLLSDLRKKMRAYARADGAFYAKWKTLFGRYEVLEDFSAWVGRVEAHAKLAAGRRSHVPLSSLICEPVDKLVGAVWWTCCAVR